MIICSKNIFSLYVLSLIISFCTSAMEPNTVVATMNVGVNPTGIALTPDNSVAYVANNNNYAIAGQNSVSVLDLTNNLPITTITDPSFNQPYTVTMNADGTKAYVTNSGGATISIINTEMNTVAGTIAGFDGPSGMVITPDGNTAYVNNYGGPIAGSGNGTTVRMVNLMTNAITGSAITVGRAPAAIAISPEGDFVYTINYVDGNPGTGTMSVIQTSNNMVVNTITGFSGPFDIALTPDGNFAYVTNFGSNNFAPFGTTVSVVDLQNNMIVKTIDLGIQPSGIAITPDGNLAYVTNYNTLYAGSNFSNLTAGQGSVNIIDIADNAVVPPTIATGQSPANIAIASSGEFAYVSNYASNTVDVIALQSFNITARGCKIKNKHGETTANKLTWKVSGTSLPVSYSIYRDKALTELVVTLSSNHTHYIDSNIQPNKKYDYYIVGTNAAGTKSTPVEIMVTETCKKDH